MVDKYICINKAERRPAVQDAIVYVGKKEEIK